MRFQGGVIFTEQPTKVETGWEELVNPAITMLTRSCEDNEHLILSHFYSKINRKVWAGGREAASLPCALLVS